MDNPRIIHAPINIGRRYAVTTPITQYDYGYLLLPEGVELPTTYEIDFSNDEKHGTSLIVYGDSEGAEVPEELIRTGKDVYAFYYFVGDGYGKTEFTWRIPNHCRPSRDGETPTPTQQSSIDQLIVRSNEAVETAEASAQAASQSESNAHDSELAAQGYAQDASGYASNAQGYANTASQKATAAGNSATAASQSEEAARGYAQTASEKADAITGLTATATTLPDGSSATASYDAETGVMSFGIPKGKDGTDGIDGDDGYSPTASVSKSGKTATITITDKNGTTSAQVEDGEDGTDGDDGISPSVSVTDITGGHRVAITDKDGTKSFDVEDGATGATPNLTIGTVETLEPTESATASITGTPENPILNLGIPQGEQGEVTLEDYYKAFPTDTASGSIASFSDGADNLPLKSLVVNIEPVQDLSNGDPSPTNICPISGWTEVDVEQSGVNVWDEELELGTFTANHEWVTGSYLGAKNPVRVVPNVTYYNLCPSGVLFVFYNSNGEYIEEKAVASNSTFTTPSGASTMRFRTFQAYGTTYNHDISINYPSTDHDYHPYTGRSITIDLGQTVYGGKLDVLSGELTVYPYYASYNGETLTGEWISDRDKYVSGTAPTIGAQVVNIGAQGVTVQLEPHEVESLHGVNNIWADSGDTEVVYRADTKLYIAKKIAEAISALS